MPATQFFEAPHSVGRFPLSAGRSPRVLIVLVNWNRAQDTIDCINSLLPASYPHYTIMLCDNGSDESEVRQIQGWAERMQSESALSFAAVAREEVESGAHTAPDETLLLVQAGSNLGFGAGNNVALRYALNGTAYDYVWLLNNDAIAERHALERLLHALESDPALGAVGSNLFSYDEPGILDSLGGGPFNFTWGIDTPYGEQVKGVNGIVPVDHIIATSMLVRTSVVRDIGLIDERYFMYREETDWCFRMRDHGWRLACCTNSIIWHKKGGTAGRKSPMHDYYAVRNMLWLMKRYSSRTLPLAEAYWFVRCILPKIARFEFQRLPAVWKAFVDFHGGVFGKIDLSHLKSMRRRSVRANDVKAP